MSKQSKSRRPMRFERTTVRAGDLHFTGPIYQPLQDIIINNVKPYTGRMVLPTDLHIDEAFRARREDVESLARDYDAFMRHEQEHNEHATVIPVMERSDGSLWVYDDCCRVEAAQRMAPNTPLACVLFRDPTQ